MVGTGCSDPGLPGNAHGTRGRNESYSGVENLFRDLFSLKCNFSGDFESLFYTEMNTRKIGGE